MNMWILISIIVLQIIAILVSIFYKSYAGKKGENLATKEDIGEITQKIESVKTDFAVKLEQLKHNLEFENSIKSVIYNERKQAVVELFENIHLYTQKLSNTLNNLILCEEVEQVYDMEDQLELLDDKVELIEAKASLYVDDIDFWEVYSETIDKIDIYEKRVYMTCESVALNLKKQYNLTERNLEVIKIFNTSKTESKSEFSEVNTQLENFRNACFKVILDPKVI